MIVIILSFPTNDNQKPETAHVSKDDSVGGEWSLFTTVRIHDVVMKKKLKHNSRCYIPAVPTFIKAELGLLSNGVPVDYPLSFDRKRMCHN